jgi:predicted DNA binding CopG/RHH family protein
MPNARKKTRDEMVGAYVTPELKERVKRAAAARGMSVADYIRWIVAENTKETK